MGTHVNGASMHDEDAASPRAFLGTYPQEVAGACTKRPIFHSGDREASIGLTFACLSRTKHIMDMMGDLTPPDSAEAVVVEPVIYY